jgi:hypothetical protein
MRKLKSACDLFTVCEVYAGGSASASNNEKLLVSFEVVFPKQNTFILDQTGCQTHRHVGTCLSALLDNQSKNAETCSSLARSTIPSACDTQTYLSG